MSKEKVLCQKGKKHVYGQQTTTWDHITVHCCISAAGTTIPPFIVNHRCPPSVAYALDGPPDSIHGYSEKGFLTTELFLKLLDHFIKHALAERPLILIMDQHETQSHHQVISVCRANHTEILLLPPHMTHILQLLDIGVFNLLKAVFTKMATWMGMVRGDMVVGKKQFSSVLKHAHKSSYLQYHLCIQEGRNLSPVHRHC